MSLRVIKRRLIEFKKLNTINNEWHEPDQMGVSAIVTGVKLDNAFGTTQRDKLPYDQELVVHLTVGGYVALSVNLATLLALATVDEFPSQEGK